MYNKIHIIMKMVFSSGIVKKPFECYWTRFGYIVISVVFSNLVCCSFSSSIYTTIELYIVFTIYLFNAKRKDSKKLCHCILPCNLLIAESAQCLKLHWNMSFCAQNLRVLFNQLTQQSASSFNLLLASFKSEFESILK